MPGPSLNKIPTQRRVQTEKEGNHHQGAHMVIMHYLNQPYLETQ